jgi:PAS domain S-box-containing protein
MNQAVLRHSVRPGAAQLESAARALQEARCARSLCVLDRDAVIVWAGDRFADQTGYAPHEAIGRRGSELLSGPATDTAVLARIRALMARGQAVIGERLVMYTKDRRPYLAEYHITPMAGTAGSLLHFLCERINIGPVALGAQAVSELQTALDLAIETAAVGLWDWDVATDTVHWSDSLCHMYGIPVEAGEPHARERWMDRVFPPDRPRIRAAVAALVAGRSDVYDCVYRFAHADGRLRHAHGRGRAQRDDDGRLRRVIGVTLDITAQREAEAAAMRAAGERRRQLALGGALADAPAGAADGAACGATGAALRVPHSPAVSEYLAQVGHELRTPLNAILGYAQLLEATQAPGPQREHARQIVEAGRHMVALVDDVVELQRLGAGALRVEREAVALSPLLARAVVLARAALPAYAGIRIDLHDTALAVRADPRRLLQVVVNLVTNALKYNSFGGRVDIACETADDGRVAIHVRDTGHGLTPPQLARLFQPFERLGAERGSTPGTGLGLVITRLLLQAMGGTIGLDSAPGWGTRATVWLPAAASGVA